MNSKHDNVITSAPSSSSSQLPPLPSPPPAVAAHSSSASARAPRLTYFRYGSLDHFAAGLTAGLVSTLALHPFDLIKTRLQVRGYNAPTAAASAAVPSIASATSASSSPFHSYSPALLRSLLRDEGASALYKGLVPNLVGNTVAWGAYFWMYDVVKRRMSEREPWWLVRMVTKTSHLPSTTSDNQTQQHQHQQRRRPLNALEHIIAASITGTCVSALTNPFWVIKTRMFLDVTPRRGDLSSVLPPDALAKVRGAENAHYRGLIDALKSIYTTEGIAGLYRGFLPGLFGVSHGAVQFMCYEELKKWRLSYKLSETSSSLDTQRVSWSTSETIVMSIGSKVFASATTYPYQVIRSRIQSSRVHITLREVIKQTWKNEGPGGFYRGLWVNLVKVMPAACTVFVVYEQMGGYMKRHATFEQKE